MFILAESAKSAVYTRVRKCCDNNCTRPCIVPALELHPHASTLKLIVPAGRIQGSTVWVWVWAVCTCLLSAQDIATLRNLGI